MDVLTHHNDISRTGTYPAETVLTPQTVQGGGFKKLFERNVSGDVYAQALYARGVRTGAVVRNLCFVATSTNHVYAFDADDHNTNANTPAVWSRQLDPSRILTGNEICGETRGSVGITSTPVIDAQSKTMFVVTRFSSPSQGGAGDGDNYLHALDIATGQDKQRPVRIAGSVPGTGPKAGTTLVFNTRCQRNRPALLLLNGVVYIAYGTFSCDGWCVDGIEPYYGWVIGYRASDLTQVAVFNTATAAAAAGIWQSGAGLAGAPDGSIYFMTGNDALLPGSPGPGTPGNLGDSVVRLEVTAGWPGLKLAGHFTPRNAEFLRDGYGPGTAQWGDTDLGSGGPTLVPGEVLIAGGKQGRIYVLDAKTMTLRQDSSPPDWALAGVNPDHVGEGFQAFYNHHFGTDPRTPRALDSYASNEAYGCNIHGNPVYWPGTGCVYHMAEKDHLKAFRYDEAARVVRYAIDSDPTTRSVISFGESTEPPNFGMPGGASSISSNGTRDGIVWVSYPRDDGQWQKVNGYLVAYGATPVGADGRTLVELWRDSDPAVFAKFCPPTVADGKVFRPTFAPNDPDNSYAAPGKLLVYGLSG